MYPESRSYETCSRKHHGSGDDGSYGAEATIALPDPDSTADSDADGDSDVAVPDGNASGVVDAGVVGDHASYLVVIVTVAVGCVVNALAVVGTLVLVEVVATTVVVNGTS